MNINTKGKKRKVASGLTPINKDTTMYQGKPAQHVYSFPIISPRWYQLSTWKAYQAGCKELFISWHRRCGKDITSTSIAVDYALQHPNTLTVLMAPELKWAKRIWWSKGQGVTTIDPVTGYIRKTGGSLLDICCPEKIRQKTLNTESRIHLHNGSVIELQGSDEKKFVGQKINCLVISETARHKKDIFPLLSPVMRESQGVTIYNGTVESKRNHFWEKLQNAKAMNSDKYHVSYLTPEDTKMYYWVSDPDPVTGEIGMNVNPELQGMIDPRTNEPYENIEERKLLGESEAFLRREYLNIPTNVEEGSYYSDLLKDAHHDGRISNDITYNESYPVYTAWDIGIRDLTAVTFYQYYDEKIYVIDYYENNGVEIKDHIDVILSKPYKYNAHFAPHDGSKREMQTGLNLLDFCRREYDFVFSHIPKTNSRISDIMVVKSYLRKLHMCKFTTTDLLVSLEAYRDNGAGGQVHDEASHGADSFRYMIMSIHKKLLQPHALLGNNRGRFYLKQKDLGTYDNVSQNPMRSNNEFPATVDDCQDYFGGNTYGGT